MNYLFPSSLLTIDRIQSRLLGLASSFLLISSLVLTLSPAVRVHSWQVEYRFAHWIGFLIWLVSFSLIHRLTLRVIPDRDPYLLPLGALLTGLGLLTIWRLNPQYGWRQTLWLALSLATMSAIFRAKGFLGILRRYKYIWLTGGLLLTALTFFFGTYPGGEGPQLWLGCCGIYLQPSEPLKLLLVVYLAAYLSDRIPVSFNLLQLLLPTLLLVGAAMVLLIAQRDLGTASLFLVLYFIIIYLASGRLEILAGSIASLAIAGVIGYYSFDVIRLRVDAWLNPWLDPSGRSYQIVQSLMAISAGQILGRGPGIGFPGFVPIAHSDFIFSSIAEEFGLAGTIAILAILILFCGRGFRIALWTSNRYYRYLAAGATTYLVIQSILIIGGNIRLLPLTGVTLPFVSYGGSSLLTSFITLSVLLLISGKADLEPAPLTNSRPYLVTGCLLFLAIAMAGLVNGWWSVIRADNLLNRTDNPRRSIVTRYVRRGEILDRNNHLIASSSGKPGSFTRLVEYPALSHVVGYTHPVYGQTGLEASLDPYLRGIQGSPASLIWSSNLLYGQPPTGLDIRLSIDLKLQNIADHLLGDTTGSLVLINAKSGEILAMASHPYYDPNQMDENMSTWLASNQGFLLNRATQATYPPGTALAPFILADYLSGNTLPDPPQSLSVRFEENTWNCSSLPKDPNSWGELITKACPGAVTDLGKQLGGERLATLYKDLGLTQTPDIPLPVAAAVPAAHLSNTLLAALGQAEVTVSPLQMALAAAVLSSQGARPSPWLGLAVNTPQEGWVILPASSPVPSLPPNGVARALQLIRSSTLPIWESTGYAFNGKGNVAWYLGGALPEWKGTPVALALALENQSPSKAQEIGLQILEAILSPEP